MKYYHKNSKEENILKSSNKIEEEATPNKWFKIVIYKLNYKFNK